LASAGASAIVAVVPFLPHCWQPQILADESGSTRSVCLNEHIDRLNAALQGRYTIQREPGSGGMATVYLAEDVTHRRQVAIKA